jgi:hypothetical protein
VAASSERKPADLGAKDPLEIVAGLLRQALVGQHAGAVDDAGDRPQAGAHFAKRGTAVAAGSVTSQER